MIYTVYGDYGTESENILLNTEYLSDAIDFCKRYMRWGDMGGYKVIEVVSLDEMGVQMVEANWFDESVFA
jgi:hypothetical protein